MNRKLTITLLFFAVFFSFKAKAQIENVIVETYYVSDDSDATDITGGFLDSGSVTYRIYVDLAQGSAIKKIFGTKNHPLKFASTAPFFNNIDRGETYGYMNYWTHLDENTVALDSYITIGQATKNSAITYAGVPKSQDPDSSIIGGAHNDGGSAAIGTGLISNPNPAAGIPVTIKDGLMAYTSPPTDQQEYGFDSTIFGPLNMDTAFVGDSVYYSCLNGMGPISGSNQVMVAQLTTKGEISFELNVEVEDINGNTIIYVASDSLSSSVDTIVSPYLKYPASCGCTNPDYVEFSSAYACNDSSQCKTLIVYGCMDPMACNYDPNANFNISTLCCYPGYCNDRNLAVVCPSLNNERMRAEGSKLYPDPAQNEVTLEIPDGVDAAVQYGIYDAYGKEVMHKDNGVSSEPVFEKIDVTAFSQGLYILRLSVGNSVYIKKFVKD